MAASGSRRRRHLPLLLLPPSSSGSLWYELAYAEAKGRVHRGHRVWQTGFGSGFKCNSADWCTLRDVPPVSAFVTAASPMALLGGLFATGVTRCCRRPPRCLPIHPTLSGRRRRLGPRRYGRSLASRACHPAQARTRVGKKGNERERDEEERSRGEETEREEKEEEGDTIKWAPHDLIISCAGVFTSDHVKKGPPVRHVSTTDGTVSMGKCPRLWDVFPQNFTFRTLS
uniref:Uncharacterized protein n=1 Tax=Oryza barthii TaxID=65489 RepID=A0A0D3G8E2_9ORYZ